MKAELYKRLFKAIYTEDIVSLKKIAITIIQEERKLGHNVLADSLEKLTITEKPKYTLFDSRRNETGLASLPKSKRNNSQLVSYIPREQLKHHMVLPEGVEERLLSIEQEYAARERLKRYNLVPKRNIMGCRKRFIRLKLYQKPLKFIIKIILCRLEFTIIPLGVGNHVQ